MQEGLEGVDSNRPETLSAEDYTMDEKKEDENAVDWDTAFNEVESGESAKLEQAQKEREEYQ